MSDIPVPSADGGEDVLFRDARSRRDFPRQVYLCFEWQLHRLKSARYSVASRKSQVRADHGPRWCTEEAKDLPDDDLADSRFCWRFAMSACVWAAGLCSGGDTAVLRTIDRSTDSGA